jgi:outer membrane receptor protein involved in Fe transport
MVKAEIALAENLKMNAQIYHSRFVADFRYRATIISMGIWLANVPDFAMDTNTVDTQLQLDYQILDDLLLTAGGYFRYTTNTSDKIIPKEIVESRAAGFLHVQYNPLEELQLTGGIRYDMNSVTEGALSPRAVVIFRPWPDHAFRLGYGLAFRKPSFTESRMHVEIDEAAFPEVIEKFTTAIGNEDLVNEKVHSIEAGWRARFFDRVLKVSADLFYNIYQDMIFFESNLAIGPLGPDISASNFASQNQETSITAFGGELAVVLEAAKEWTLWGNLGLRWVEDEEDGALRSEPTLRANLGCRWSGQRVFADLALHYVSAYEFPVLHPEETFEMTEWMKLGDRLLAVSRVGYRHPLGESGKLEAGFSVRAPIGGRFREYPGVSIQRTPRSLYGSDYVGEPLVRLVSFYLRGSF